MITAVGWVRRGIAKQTPVRFEPTKDYLAEITDEAEEDADRFGVDLDEDAEWEDENDDDSDDDAMEATPAAASSAGGSGAKTGAGAGKKDKKDKKDKKKRQARTEDQMEAAADELAKYNLDTYEEEPSALNMFGSLRGLQYYRSNDEDPFVTLKEEADSDPEDNDFTIEPTDCIILAAKTEDDLSHLEIYVYEEDEDNLFIHHDVMLPSYPLCLEWLNYNLKDGGALGNFVAMGTFQPEIEIWDLDVIDALYPHAILGRSGGPAKSTKLNPSHHTDAVLGLSWNKQQRSMLASCSADTSVKLWDLSKGACLRSLQHHQAKVQVVAWSPTEASVLLTGAYDRQVCVLDVRSPTAVSTWTLTADVECAKWNPFASHAFVATSEDGLATCFDARKAGSHPVFTLSAHDEAASSLDFSLQVPGCMLTSSYDKTVKIWDVLDMKPALVHTRDMGMGKIFASSFSPDSGLLVAVAGGKGKVEVWNASEVASVQRRFASRLPAAPNPLG